MWRMSSAVGGSEDPCLLFMDRGESAVKMSRIYFEEAKGQGENESVKHLRLSVPEILASDPTHTGDRNTRRSSLAVNSKRDIIAFSYDFEDTCINIYDMKRKVSVTVPVPEGAGWIRDIEFSPNGKKLVVAHCTFQRVHGETISICAISVFDCDVDRIECISERPPKLFRVKERGYCCGVAFSPKGNMLSFAWRPQLVYRRTIFGYRERVGMIDLSPTKDADDGSQISREILSEAPQWERFVRS